jgi:murein DD-endopeptidase MepM/ murein hydrolase activator NlpD
MIFSPLPGNPLVTQGFGQNAESYAPYGMQGHNGIDFGIPEGTVVYAPHDGTATVKDNGTKDYGLHVIIDDGSRRSYLAHLSEATVTNGQRVYQGDPIGKSGKSGDATGPHLHWTYKILKNGVVQNKDNGFEGAVDVTEFTRLWLDQDLHHDAQYADSAQDYLAMSFTAQQYLKNPNRVA